MFNSLSPLTQRRLQYALAISGLVAGVAAIITFVLAGVVLFVSGLPAGHPFVMFMPQAHLGPGMMPRGSLDSGMWLMMIASYSGLLVGVTSFVILYLGRADAN